VSCEGYDERNVIYTADDRLGVFMGAVLATDYVVAIRRPGIEFVAWESFGDLRGGALSDELLIRWEWSARNGLDIVSDV
jgi:hypothetical protein